jgi:hypothetical protein
VAVEERRISALAFLGQCVLLSLLLAGRIYQPVAALKGFIGIPIAMILYISASHIESERRKQRTAQKARDAEEAEAEARGAIPTPGESPIAAQPQPASRAGFLTQPEAVPFAEQIASIGTSPTFRILVVTLGAAAAYGLWQAYPIALLPPQINLACYWLLITGLLLAATSQDPLRIGIALLTLLNGFETGYYALNTSLMLVGLMGAGEILIALVTANASEQWLSSTIPPEKETA